MSQANEEYLEQMEWEFNSKKQSIPTSMEEPVQFYYGFHEQTLLDSLLRKSNYEDPIRAGIQRDIEDMGSMTEEKYYRLLVNLHDAQLDPVLAGRYKDKDLKKYRKRFWDKL